MTFISGAVRHARILGALIMREVTTRYGRENAGFLWVIGEPMAFCVGVIILWSALKPAYEHGIRVAPFVMTGYMCLMLLRHMMTMSVGALQANVGLLFHRQISVLHIFVARNILEFAGVSVAFVVVYLALLALGQVGLPHDWFLLYMGWLLMAWVSLCVALFFAALALRYEIMERVTAVVGYIMIPFSGVFIMVAWIPQAVREIYLLVPLPHGVEMVRGAVFGEFVHVYYNPLYAFSFGVVLLFIAVVLMSDARDRILVE